MKGYFIAKNSFVAEVTINGAGKCQNMIQCQISDNTKYDPKQLLDNPRK